MKIALGTDHAGYPLKEVIRQYLSEELGHEVIDYGCFSPESVDYPVYVQYAARHVADGTCDLGVVFGGSGNGEAIAANKVKGIRCGLCWSLDSARLAKEHNNANIISMGARLVDAELAKEIVKTWLDASFEGGRHKRRIDQLDHDLPPPPEFA